MALLNREFGSAYSVTGEQELERHCERLPWEGVLEVVSCRRRETEVVRKLLDGAELPEEMRLILEEALGAYPDRDIRLLAAARAGGYEGGQRGADAGHARASLEAYSDVVLWPHYSLVARG